MTSVKSRSVQRAFVAAAAISMFFVSGCSAVNNGTAPSPAAGRVIFPEEVDKGAAAALHADLLKVGPERFTASDYKPGEIRHVVLFKFTGGTSVAKQDEVMSRFRALATEATRDGKPYVVSLEAGTQTSGEGAGQNMKQAFILTFASEGDRNYYVGSPIVSDSRFYDKAHQSFKEFVGPLVESALVFDFNVNK
ncbi:Dabb family protein [Streptomyces vinaceus]